MHQRKDDLDKSQQRQMIDDVQTDSGERFTKNTSTCRSKNETQNQSHIAI